MIKMMILVVRISNLQNSEEDRGPLDPGPGSPYLAANPGVETILH
jgi:hypothetical protein